MEEKLLYQVELKTQDLQYQLESCEFRINRMEVQQAHQQQMQVENSLRNTISIGAVFNLLIYLLSLLLIVLQTMFGMFNPFMTTRLRYFTTFFIVLISSLVWYNWGIISPMVYRWIYVYYYDMPVPQ